MEAGVVILFPYGKMEAGVVILSAVLKLKLVL